jgi:hypothetical protein
MKPNVVDINMNKHLRNRVASLFLLMPCAVAVLALPVTAIAQSAAAEVSSMQVSSDRDFRPGAHLTFRVQGTPRSQAMVRVEGLRNRIALREVSPGLFIGRYTVTRADRIDDDTEVRATLRKGNKSSTANYTFAEVMGNQTPVVVAPPALPPPAAPALRIERFGVVPFDRLEPGAELRFVLEGMPGATASVDLPGVSSDAGLREMRPGHYEGSYTLRRADNLTPARPVVATLRQGDRVATANLMLAPGQPQVQPGADNRAPNVMNLLPREGEVVPAAQAIQVSASFEDRGGSGVDPASVRMMLSGRNVTPEAQITANSVTYRGALAPGHYAVDVSARDRAGNAVRRDWSFEVAAAVPVNVPLQITNHGNNSPVDGGPVRIEGRTAPLASVAVVVDAAAPVPGGLSFSQQIYSQTVQADNNGLFNFTFSPRYAIPGARYTIGMTASKAGVNTQGSLQLMQR